MNRMKQRDGCKDATITIRVTSEKKEKIRKKAAKKKKSTSEYVADAAMAGLESRRSKDRREVIQLVENQEILNDVFHMMMELEVPYELQDRIKDLAEGENKLWQCW